MESHHITLIIVLFFLVLLSAFFSACEMAFTSLSRARIKNMAAKGNKKAQRVLKLLNNFDGLLSTILVGNNIVNITSSSIATLLFVSWLGNRGASVSSVVMTVVILIFGEITPKSLAAESSVGFALSAAPVLSVLNVLLTPVNFLFTKWKKLVAKVFKNAPKDEGGFNEEELLTIVEEAHDTGGIGEHESRMLKSVLEFGESRAEEVLTPRVDVVALPIDCTREELSDLFLETEYSRIPIFEESIDNIKGVIHHKDFLTPGLLFPHEMIKPVLYVTTGVSVQKLLLMMQQSKNHMAVVCDEFGGTVGIVTMEDILEELVGEIYDEHDDIEDEIRRLKDGSYRISGALELDELCERFGFALESDKNTVGGWIMEQTGKVPETGDSFYFDRYHISVSEVEGRRVLEVLLRPIDRTAD